MFHPSWKPGSSSIFGLSSQGRISSGGTKLWYPPPHRCYRTGNFTQVLFSLFFLKFCLRRRGLGEEGVGGVGAWGKRGYCTENYVNTPLTLVSELHILAETNRIRIRPPRKTGSGCSLRKPPNITWFRFCSENPGLDPVMF